MHEIFSSRWDGCGENFKQVQISVLKQNLKFRRNPTSFSVTLSLLLFLCLFFFSHLLWFVCSVIIIFVSINLFDAVCETPLGMQSGAVKDADISASSSNSSHGATNARPFNYVGWCAQVQIPRSLISSYFLLQGKVHLLLFITRKYTFIYTKSYINNVNTFFINSRKHFISVMALAFGYVSLTTILMGNRYLLFLAIMTCISI